MANVQDLGTTSTHQNCIHSTMKSRLHFRNVCTHSAHQINILPQYPCHNIFLSRLEFRMIAKIKLMHTFERDSPSSNVHYCGTFITQTIVRGPISTAPSRPPSGIYRRHTIGCPSHTTDRQLGTSQCTAGGLTTGTAW
jgi:hypothetical protein